jgi:hypothetical protein
VRGELHRIEWQHPRLGRISETVCPSHEGEVLAGLRTLGIGSGGCIETERDACDRCTHRGLRSRVWLLERAQ